MQTAIERLRASKQSETQQRISDGNREGRDWAANYGSYSALKRLAAIDTSLYDGGGSGDIFAAIKWAVDPNDEHDSQDTVKALFGDEAVIPDEWLVAWIEGVQEFFAEVRTRSDRSLGRTVISSQLGALPDPERCQQAPASRSEVPSAPARSPPRRALFDVAEFSQHRHHGR